MSFVNIDTAFLKEEVGPVLARGLADTVIAGPSDPVEYLALWLLHHLQLQELEEQARIKREQEYKEQEEWLKGRQRGQHSAALVIQREWKHFVKGEEDRKFREKRLLEVVTERERELEEMEEFKEDNINVEDAEGLNDIEREKLYDKLRAAMQFKKASLILQKLDKSAVAEVKQLKKPSPAAVSIVKCALYALGAVTPKQARVWQQVRMAVKPSLFLEKAIAFDPVAVGSGPPKKRRALVRVRRILRGVAGSVGENGEELKAESIVVFLLYQWLSQAVEYRTRHDEDVKLRRANGKEVEEEEEEEVEEDEGPQTEKDPEEEAQRLIEEEERRKQEEEEARLRAENGEDELHEEED